LLFHSVLKFTHLELFLVWVLISWGFEFFSPGVPVVFLSEECAGNTTSFRVLVVVQITSFLSAGTSLQSQWGARGLCALWEAGLLAPAV
jgi:hypothetical protein